MSPAFTVLNGLSDGSSVDSEVSLAQDDNLFNFIFIELMSEIYNSVHRLSVKWSQAKPETKVQYQYEQL